MGITHNFFIIAVTGGIACGKSETGKILESLGFDICDSDTIAHELLKKDTSVYREIINHFGNSILTIENEISRPTLGKIIFKNPQERKKLNKIIHPKIKEKINEWILKQRKKKKNGAVLLPLLFETSMENLNWDAIFCVSSSSDLIFQRLEKRGLTHKEAEQRIRSQMKLKEKEKRADWVISNTGTLNDLNKNIQKIVRYLNDGENYD